MGKIFELFEKKECPKSERDEAIDGIIKRGKKKTREIESALRSDWEEKKGEAKIRDDQESMPEQEIAAKVIPFSVKKDKE